MVTLWRSLQLIRETGRDILTEDELEVASRPHVEAWEARYRATREKLMAAGYAVAPGATAYVRLRRSWDPMRAPSWRTWDPAGRTSTRSRHRCTKGTICEGGALARR